MKNPKLITKPFAQNGQKNAIPENFSSSMESNQATWDTGFGQITMIPVAAGGLPPKGQDFNGIFNQLSENIVYLSKGGKFKFSVNYAASINGYPKGAILQSDDETKEYQSIIDNNKVNFNTATQAQINAAWNLFSTDDMPKQLAGKQPAGNYALKGESYTKGESNTNFQPKGDYATNTALNNGLNTKLNTSSVVQGTGTSTTQVVSQDGVSKALNTKTDANIFQSKTASGNAVILPAGSPIAFIFNKDGSFNLYDSELGTKFSVDKDGEVTRGKLPFARVTDAPLLGIGQKWKSVTRQINTLYTNTTKSPIFVFARASQSSNNFQFRLEVDGVIADSISVHGTATGTSSTTTKELSCNGIVPPGVSYRFVAGGLEPSGISISYASELS